MEPARPYYIAFPQEVMHALTLFRSLNATDWAVLMVIAHYTYGRQREAAEIGGSVFRDRIARPQKVIARSLKKLTTPAKDGGFGMVLVIEDRTATSGRILSIDPDWMAWGWESEEDLAACAAAMVVYSRRSVQLGDDWRPTDPALHLARLLCEHCEHLVPLAEIVPADLADRRFRRWCHTFERLLENRSYDELVAVLRYVHGSPFWASRILGDVADHRLSRSIQTLAAQAAANRQRR